MQIDFEALRRPLDEGGGCGPDLEWDAQIGQLLAELDGVLPTQSERYYEFRKRPPDLDPKIGELVAALARSRDLRMMVPLARAAALKGDIETFERSLELMRHYLDTSWDAVHPLPADGDQGLRVVELERLDEFASVVLPLQYARLVADKAGHVAYRDLAVAAGEAAARDGETFASKAEIDRLLKFAKIETLLTVRDLLRATAGHVTAIEARLTEVDGGAAAVSFPRLSALLGKMLEKIDDALALRSSELPAEALAAELVDDDEAEDAAMSGDAALVALPQATGRVASHADATAALSAACDYFDAHEPSSPALLLTRRARSLVGLSFPQLVEALAPGRLPQTRIELPGVGGFVLALEALGTAFPPPAAPASVTRTEFGARNRVEAAALLSEVTAFYRGAEPSNPIPLLLDKARTMFAKDFAALLAELTPKA